MGGRDTSLTGQTLNPSTLKKVQKTRAPLVTYPSLLKTSSKLPQRAKFILAQRFNTLPAILLHLAPSPLVAAAIRRGNGDDLRRQG